MNQVNHKRKEFLHESTHRGVSYHKLLRQRIKGIMVTNIRTLFIAEGRLKRLNLPWISSSLISDPTTIPIVPFWNPASTESEVIWDFFNLSTWPITKPKISINRLSRSSTGPRCGRFAAKTSHWPIKTPIKTVTNKPFANWLLGNWQRTATFGIHWLV